MVDVPERFLAIVRRILNDHVPGCEVRVFGSRARGGAGRYSDLDLAVVAREMLPRRTMVRLKEEFEESSLPFRVDVIDWHAISAEFRKVIESGYDVL